MKKILFPGTAEPFVAQDNFKCITTAKHKPPIRWMNDEFIEGFLTKTEPALPPRQLCKALLIQRFSHTKLRDELGARYLTRLSELFFLMEHDAKHRFHFQKFLSADEVRRGNSFFMLDVHGMPQLVWVRWGKKGWNIQAEEISDACSNNYGTQIFFPYPYQSNVLL